MIKKTLLQGREYTAANKTNIARTWKAWLQSQGLEVPDFINRFAASTLHVEIPKNVASGNLTKPHH